MPKLDESTLDSKSVTLYAKTTDANSTAYPLTIDGISHLLPTLDISHHEIHEGNHFYFENVFTLNTSGILYIKLITADTAKWTHLTWEIECTGILETTLYEDVAGGMTGGSSVTSLNNDRNSATTSGNTIISGVTVATTLGTTVSIKKVGGTGFKIVTGGEVRRDDEIIMKQGATYLRSFLSGSDNNILHIKAKWYEHTNISED